MLVRVKACASTLRDADSLQLRASERSRLIVITFAGIAAAGRIEEDVEVTEGVQEETLNPVLTIAGGASVLTSPLNPGAENTGSAKGDGRRMGARG